MAFEVAIGIVLIYLVLAVVSSAVTELVSQVFNLRSEGLWATVRKMLHDPEGTGIAKNLYNHSLISEGKAAVEDFTNAPKPSYIKSKIFSVALISQLGGDQYSTEKLLECLPKDGELAKAVRPLVEAAGTDPKRAHRNIEAWFESAVQRATEWYARQTRLILAFVGLVIAFTCNADTLMLVQSLRPHAAEQVRAQSLTKATPSTRPSSVETRLEPKPIPAGMIGWSGPSSANDPAYNANDPRRFPAGLWAWGLKLLGLSLTAFAISMIAPFLYNLFRRLGQGRSAAKAAKQTKQEAVPQAFAPKVETVVAETIEPDYEEVAATVEEVPEEIQEAPAPAAIGLPAEPEPIAEPEPVVAGEPAPVKSNPLLDENVEVVSAEDIMALLNSPDPIDYDQGPAAPVETAPPVSKEEDENSIASPDEIAALLAAASAAPAPAVSIEADDSSMASPDDIAALLAAANAVPAAAPVVAEVEDGSSMASAEDIAALLAAANASPAPAPVVAEVEDGSSMASADDIAALLAAANATPAPSAAKVEEDSSMASPDDIAALLAAANGKPAPSAALAEESGIASSDEIAAMLEAANSSLPQASAADNFVSQDEISRLLEEAMNADPGELVYPELEKEPETINPVTEDLGAVSAEEIESLMQAMKASEDPVVIAKPAKPKKAAAQKTDDSEAMSADDIAALLESMKDEPGGTGKDNKEAA